MKNYAVIGLCYGDEGKGLITSYLASKNPNHCVARYSGGSQATHKVMIDENNFHIFSTIGSGALHGNNTYIYKTCLVNPIKMVQEIEQLVEKEIYPKITIHNKCPIMTPYDAYANKNDTMNRFHGTCGQGIGKTIQREEDFYSLLFEDIFDETILDFKLQAICAYYNYNEGEKYKQLFIDSCKKLLNYKHLIQESYKADVIFESSQGLLLDQNIGFFPHVTRGNTSTVNIRQFKPQIYLVTRAYQTRHGNGPMTNYVFGGDPNIKLSKYEHNISNAFQGEFKYGALDLNLLRYAINKDHYIKENKKNLAITCLDNLVKYQFTLDKKMIKFDTEKAFVDAIINELKIDGQVLLSRTPFTDKVEIYK
jgi:adenylosuccinate synthase